MPRPIDIWGEGVAGSCCAHLLDGAGFAVDVRPANRPKLPAIMVSAQTQQLIEDVFDQRAIFVDFHQIRQRVVAWGANAKPVAVPHSAVAVAEQDLLSRLQSKYSGNEQEQAGAPEWTVIASRPLAAQSVHHEFGSRMATASAVRLKASSSTDSCWVESLERGWLFLLPAAAKSAWLLAVGAAPESLLGSSNLIGGQIAELTGDNGRFACHPQISDPLCAPGWMACGTAALAFDPLCGDGAGNAVREGILASAVIQASYQGEDVDALLDHYRARLLGGFGRHLALCQEFYQSGGSGSWWREQTDFACRGLEWCRQRLADLPAPIYRLNGSTLEPLTKTSR